MLFDNISGEDEYKDNGWLGDALVEMKREDETRSLLLKRYTHYARVYGEQNPQAVRTPCRMHRAAVVAYEVPPPPDRMKTRTAEMCENEN
jgi:hypothetical protein